MSLGHWGDGVYFGEICNFTAGTLKGTTRYRFIGENLDKKECAIKTAIEYPRANGVEVVPYSPLCAYWDRCTGTCYAHLDAQWIDEGETFDSRTCFKKGIFVTMNLYIFILNNIDFCIILTTL